MVTATRLPGLVAPEWLRRQQEQRPASNNVNINDIYWRKPGGWLTFGPSAIPGSDGRPLTAQAESLIRRGWTPLIEFSYTNRISGKTGQRETIEITQDRLLTPDCFYWLFVNGGAHLFSIEQIVEHHWHLNPPFYPHGTKAEDVFPQLQEWIVPEAYWCPACPGDRPPKNSEEQVSTHLIIFHSMTSVQVNDLYGETEGCTAPPRSSSGLNLRRRILTDQNKAETRQRTPSPEPVVRSSVQICNNCGERIEGRLADHVCAINTQNDATALQPPTVALEHAALTPEEAQIATSAPSYAPVEEASPPADSAAPRRRSRPRPRAK